MAATFIVEDGSGLSNSNAYVSVADADSYLENYENPATWTAADQATKEAAIRKATRYMDIQYPWKGEKVSDTQALQWPRVSATDEDDYGVDSDIVPTKVKYACSYLASKVVAGEDLLADLSVEAAVKRKSESLGPMSESIEYFGSGDEPGSKYQIADGLVSGLVNSTGNSCVVDIRRV